MAGHDVLGPSNADGHGAARRSRPDQRSANATPEHTGHVQNSQKVVFVVQAEPKQSGRFTPTTVGR